MHGSNVLLYPHRVAPVSAAGVGAAAYGALNRIAALMLLVLFAPLLLYIAWRIAREDGSPSLFAHYRVGRSGELFRCLKFRTMAHGADEILRDLLADDAMAREEWERDHKLRNDPRITGFGRFLRRTSLDELPQLWNILLGDMSFVGPRPAVLEEVAQYQPWQRRRLSMQPGLTCLWQVSGRNELSFDEWMRLDLEYIDNWSLWLDVKIALRTIPAVLFGRGAR
jgi:lipopolysaccharide/colanic/teichoic acid biosynthesis glycosyltransferase